MKPIQFLLAKINEAYFIEHNLPCERHFTHDELADAFTEVRAAHLTLYGQPPAAEPCTDLRENELRPAILKPEGDLKQPG